MIESQNKNFDQAQKWFSQASRLADQSPIPEYILIFLILLQTHEKLTFYTRFTTFYTRPSPGAKKIYTRLEKRV